MPPSSSATLGRYPGYPLCLPGLVMFSSVPLGDGSKALSLQWIKSIILFYAVLLAVVALYEYRIE